MDMEIFELPLKALKISGLDPRVNSVLDKVKRFISVVTMVVLFVTTVMEIQRREWSITTIIPTVETFMMGMQGLTRWLVAVIFKKKITELMRESKTFWNINEEDPDDESGADSTMRLIWKGMRIYATSVFISITLTIIMPILFAWRKALPFIAWFPQDYTYGYEIFFAVQLLFIVTLSSSAVGIDMFYAAFCGILIAQLRMLNRKLENITNIKINKDFVLNLQEIVEYHVKLIKFGEMIEDMYSALLLVHYVITMVLTCVELYTVSENTSDVSHIIKFTAFTFTLILRMGIYCFLAEAIMDESQNTAIAVYSTDWYSRDVKEVGFYVQMIIARASNAITFSGAGLVLIGRVLWFNVFKMSFSVYTLLTSLK